MAKKIRKREVATASPEEARKFTQALQAKFRGRKRTVKEEERLRQLLARFDAEYLRSVARRVIIDIVKGPGQTPRDGGKSPPSAPPPSRQGRGAAAPAGGAGAKATRRPGGKRVARARKPTATRSRG